jgi:hypothetical protein
MFIKLTAGVNLTKFTSVVTDEEEQKARVFLKAFSPAIIFLVKARNTTIW